jgi:hypothetical protein
MYRRHERSLNTKFAMRMRRPETRLKYTQSVRYAYTVEDRYRWDNNIKMDFNKYDRTWSVTLRE